MYKTYVIIPWCEILSIDNHVWLQDQVLFDYPVESGLADVQVVPPTATHSAHRLARLPVSLILKQLHIGIEDKILSPQLSKYMLPTVK